MMTSYLHQGLHCLGSFLQTLLTITTQSNKTARSYEAVSNSLLALRLQDNHIHRYYMLLNTTPTGTCFTNLGTPIIHSNWVHFQSIRAASLWWLWPFTNAVKCRTTGPGTCSWHSAHGKKTRVSTCNQPTPLCWKSRSTSTGRFGT